MATAFDPATIDWNLLRALGAVFAHGSLMQAAVRLGTSQPTLSYPFDPTANGQYSIFLEVIGPAGVVGRSNIDVIVGTGAVPEPASLALVGLALAGLAAASRRKTR